jgi:hypothetical protein
LPAPWSRSEYLMGIRKQPQVVAVRQGGGRKINECYSETKKN